MSRERQTKRNIERFIQQTIGAITNQIHLFRRLGLERLQSAGQLLNTPILLVLDIIIYKQLGFEGAQH